MGRGRPPRSTFHSLHEFVRLPRFDVVQIGFLAQRPVIRNYDKPLRATMDSTHDPIVGLLRVSSEDDLDTAAAQFPRRPADDTAIKDHRHLSPVVATPDAQTRHEAFLIVFVLQAYVLQNSGADNIMSVNE
jgi:hypothetical protein